MTLHDIELLALSVAPVIIIFFYINYRDKYEKEPIGLLLACFFAGFFGVVAGTLAMVFGLYPFILPDEYVPSGAVVQALHGSFWEAALPEELFKFLFLYLITWRHKAFNEKFDGIVYAVIVSLGFACSENILYVFGSEDGYTVGFMRAILAVPGHAFFGVIMGYYYSWAKFSEHKSWYLSLSLGGAILAHGLYNFFLMYIAKLGAAGASNLIILALFALFFFFIISLWILGFYKIKKHVGRSVFKP